MCLLTGRRFSCSSEGDVFTTIPTLPLLYLRGDRRTLDSVFLWMKRSRMLILSLPFLMTFITYIYMPCVYRGRVTCPNRLVSLIF